MTPRDWSGQVELDKGEVVDIEGLRFRDGDQVTGRDSWKCRSRSDTQGAAATKKAAAKASGQRPRPRRPRKPGLAKARRQTRPGRHRTQSTIGPTSPPMASCCHSKTLRAPLSPSRPSKANFPVAARSARRRSGAFTARQSRRVQRGIPHAPLVEGTISKTSRRGTRLEGNGAGLPRSGIDGAGAQSFCPRSASSSEELRRRSRPRGRRSGPPAQFPRRQGRYSARRHRARPRRLAPGGGRVRRRRNRHRLDRKTRRQLGRVLPPV